MCILFCLSPEMQREAAAKGRYKPGRRFKTILNRSKGEKSLEESQSGCFHYADPGMSQHLRAWTVLLIMRPFSHCIQKKKKKRKKKTPLCLIYWKPPFSPSTL